MKGNNIGINGIQDFIAISKYNSISMIDLSDNKIDNDQDDCPLMIFNKMQGLTVLYL